MSKLRALPAWCLDCAEGERAPLEPGRPYALSTECQSIGPLRHGLREGSLRTGRACRCVLASTEVIYAELPMKQKGQVHALSPMCKHKSKTRK